MRQPVRQVKLKRRREKIKPIQIIAPLIFAVVVFCAWEAYCRIAEVRVDVLPPPTMILGTLFDKFTSAYLEDFLITLRIIGTGYIIAVPTGFVLAALCSQSETLTKTITPPIIIMVTIPMITLIPLLTLWMGIVIEARILVVVFQAVPVICLNTMNGFRLVETAKQELFTSLGANRWQRFIKLQFPNALPQVFTGLKLGCIFSTIAAVGADLTGRNFGLGTKISVYAGNLLVDMSLAAIVLVAAIALVAFEIVAQIQKRVITWK